MEHNILYLPTRYFPSISGAEFYLQRMAEILTKDFGYKIDISTSNAIDFKALREPHGKILHSSEEYYDQVNNLIINRFPINYDISDQDKLNFIKNLDECKSLGLSDELLMEYLKNGPFLPNLIEHFLNASTKKYHLIHSTFFPYFNLIMSLIIGKKFNIPIVVTPFFHFSNPRYMNLNISGLLNKFDLIIACTNKEKEVLVDKIGIKPDKITVIPMGVDFEKFNQSMGKHEKTYSFKETFLKNKGTYSKMVLYCGYKNYEKGALSLLKAIPYVLKKKKNTYFVFIGPSTMAYNRELSKIKKNPNATTKIINLTPENLNGYFDKKKITAFKETDIYAMPSRSDAFGIAFLEAWASGKPVIGANIGATPEVIINHKDGLLAEFDNPEDLANKILYLLKSKRTRKKLGSAGQDKVKKDYKWCLIAKMTHIKYQELINKKF